MKILDWIKQHKLITLLILIIFYFVYAYYLRPQLYTLQSVGWGNRLGTGYDQGISTESVVPSMGGVSSKIALEGPEMYPVPGDSFTPQPNVANRLVIENSYLSLLVKDVTQVKDQLIDYATQNGGYMVSAQISNPQDAPTASVVIRIPSVKLKEALTFFRTLAVKVVSENLDGQDVTDQFVDIEKHIQILETTKVKFESILAQAQEISDITNLNQQIISIQSQIDGYKGQQEALEKNAQLSKITFYVSTDEIALPYAPSETFRPEVIFKLAVRSLVSNLRQIATLVIWVTVYGVVWLPLVLIAIFIYKWFLKTNTIDRRD